MARKWFKIGAGVAIGITSIIGLFIFLSMTYGFVITDLTGNVYCDGTYNSPCISEFTVKNPTPYDVDIYSKDQAKLDFSPQIKDYALFVSDGRCSATGNCACELKDGSKIGFKGWRCVDFTNKTKPVQNMAYNFRFAKYSTTKFRLVGIKNNPKDTIKWGFTTTNSTLDPFWYGTPLVNTTQIYAELGSTLNLSANYSVVDTSNSFAFFDGVNDFINTSKTNNLTSNFTISLWMKPSSNIALGGRFTILGTYTPGWMIDLPDDSNVEGVRFYDGSVGYKYSYPGNTIPLTWTNVIFTKEGNNVSIWINGTFKQNWTVTSITASVNKLNIGRRTDAFYYNGSLDNIIIMNRSLSSSEISALYNLGIKANYTDPSIVSNWRFDYNSLNISIDSANWNNGTMNGTNYSYDNIDTLNCIDFGTPEIQTVCNSGLNNFIFNATYFYTHLFNDSTTTTNLSYNGSPNKTLGVTFNKYTEILNASIYAYGYLTNYTIPGPIKIYVGNILSNSYDYIYSGLITENKINNVTSINKSYSYNSTETMYFKLPKSADIFTGYMNVSAYNISLNISTDWSDSFDDNNISAEWENASWGCSYGGSASQQYYVLESGGKLNVYTSTSAGGGVVEYSWEGLRTVDTFDDNNFYTIRFITNQSYGYGSSDIRVSNGSINPTGNCFLQYFNNLGTQIYAFPASDAQNIYELTFNGSSKNLTLTKDGSQVYNGIVNMPGMKITFTSLVTIVAGSGYASLNLYDFSINSTRTVATSFWPNNPTIDVGGDGSSDWFYSGTFNTTQNTTSNFETPLTNYLTTCNSDADGYCNVPIYMYSSPGGINLTGINITYTHDSNPIILNATAMNDYLANHTGDVTIPITISNEANGTLEIKNLTVLYLGGNQTFLVSVSNAYYLTTIADFYSNISSVIDLDNAFDADFDTYAYVNSNSTGYINSTFLRPDPELNFPTALLQVKDSLGDMYNLTVPNSCLTGNVDILVDLSCPNMFCGYHPDYYCYNGTGYMPLIHDYGEIFGIEHSDVKVYEMWLIWLANDKSANNTMNITEFYSGWNYSFPNNINYLEFIPKSPTAKNVTPFGQTNSKPILNLTNLGFGGRNANMFASISNSSCITIYASTNNTKPSSTLWDGLKIYYPFDVDTRDVIGTYNATNVNAIWNNSGKMGGDYEFTAQPKYLTTPYAATNFNGNFSVSVWFYPKATQNANARIIAAEDYSPNRGWHTEIRNITLGQITVYASTGSWNYNMTPNYLQWHNLIITWQNSTSNMTFYIDGVVGGSSTAGTMNLTSVAYNLSVGISSWLNTGHTFNGSIDELRVWNKTLSPSEAQEIYTRSYNNYYDVKLVNQGRTINWNQPFLNSTNLWMWADYSCNYTSWQLFNPDFQIKNCCMNCTCDL